MSEQNQMRIDGLRRALEAGLIDQPTFDAVAAALGVQLAGSGAIASGHGTAVGRQGVAIDGDGHGDVTTGDRRLFAAPGAQLIYAEKGATVVIGDAPVPE